MDNKIDFVLTWVDGNDPRWKETKKHYEKIEGIYSSDSTADCRFRDWEILKYWFRAVSENAPWVNNIYVVTCDQIPDFLNLDNPKIHVISHKDYIQECYLPTFSSHCIENNFHNIKGLSEQFVYFNDDVFINKPVKKEDFFIDGKPCYQLILGCIAKPDDSSSTYQCAKYNSLNVVHKYFKNKNLFKNCFKAVNGLKNNLNNLFVLMQHKYMTEFVDFHVATPHLKATYNKLWNKEKTVLELTNSNRFRSQKDVSHYLFRYWNLASGNFTPKNMNSKCYGITKETINEITNDISNADHTQFCINDSETATDFEYCKKKLIEAFEKRYPNKCEYEK